MNRLFVVLLLSTFSPAAFGQERFPNTIFFSDSVGSPKADLNVVHWIEGLWRGEAFGGITEEVWTPALGGSMMCAFKLVVNGEVKFYELVTIVQENGTLILRLKHFHSDLKGWEKQNETQDFRLVKVTPTKVYFDGFTFERLSNSKMNVYVVVQNGEAKKEVRFSYTKAR